MSRQPLLLALSYSLLLIDFSGCGGGEIEDDRPERTKISGIVTHKGTPIEGATITFKPIAQDGRGASGRTDSSGKYELGTFESNDGAMPGEYVVIVTKFKLDDSNKGVSEDDPNYDGGGDESATPAEPENELPAKYADVAQSDLKATVGEEAVSDLNFELTD